MRLAHWAPRVFLLAAGFAFALVPHLSAAEVGPQAGETEVQVWPGAQAGQVVVIASQTLPDSVELPAIMRLPVPAGMKVDWAGEILAQPTGPDPQREVQLKDGDGGRYAEFRLSESRQGQIELSGVPLGFVDGRASLAIDWVQSTPSPLTSFSVRLPPNAAEVSIDPAPVGAPDRNEAGETLYTLPSRELDVGATQSLAVSYSTGGVAPQSGAAGGGDDQLLIGMLLALIAVALAALIFAVAKQRRQAE